MTVWPYLMATAAACVACTVLAGDRAMARLSLMILAAYIGGRVIKAHAPADIHLLAFALLWLSVAVADAIQRQVDTKTALLSAVALCYLWAKMASSAWVYGSAPFVVSDILALAVMLLILKGASGALVGRVADLGYNLGRSEFDRVSRVAAQAEEGAQG